MCTGTQSQLYESALKGLGTGRAAVVPRLPAGRVEVPLWLTTGVFCCGLLRRAGSCWGIVRQPDAAVRARITRLGLALGFSGDWGPDDAGNGLSLADVSYLGSALIVLSRRRWSLAVRSYARGLAQSGAETLAITGRLPAGPGAWVLCDPRPFRPLGRFSSPSARD